MKCSTVDPRRYIQEINEQSAQDKSCTKKSSNVNLVVSRKNKYQIDYFIAGPENKADKNVSAILRQEIHEFTDVSEALAVLMEYFLLQAKDKAKPCQVSVHNMCYSWPLKMNSTDYKTSNCAPRCVKSE